ncbi:MAG TPA: alpha-1,2-fucosyltransferase [Candidatus Paceibacterota bacterium]
MICNELYNEQGLGNQIWAYAVTRIIAQRNGCDFSILKKERFKGQSFMDIDFGAPIFGGHTSKKGYLFTLPKGIKHYYAEKRELLGNTLLDMTDDISRTDPNLLSIPSYTKFDGNCQSVKYLQGHREDILKWLPIKEEYQQYRTDENVCVIHLRCGDFMQSKAFLPIQYYKNAMEHMRSINPDIVFQCVTDQKEAAEKLLPGVSVIGSALLEKKDTHKAGHHHGGPVGIDFSLLLHAHYLIIPNSSFSWWAAYLNVDKKTVVAPKYWARFNIADGLWSPSDIITDDFTYIDKEGRMFSSSQCWSEKDAFEEKNAHLFNADNALNKPWKKHRFLITVYGAFFIKKLPTIKRRFLALLGH